MQRVSFEDFQSHIVSAATAAPTTQAMLNELATGLSAVSIHQMGYIYLSMMCSACWPGGLQVAPLVPKDTS